MPAPQSVALPVKFGVDALVGRDSVEPLNLSQLKACSYRDAPRNPRLGLFGLFEFGVSLGFGAWNLELRADVALSVENDGHR